jgi:hypothetical protein
MATLACVLANPGFTALDQSPGATIRDYRIVQTEGSRQVSRLVDHDNLDEICATSIDCPRYEEL